jgi:hypothetical protein
MLCLAPFVAAIVSAIAKVRSDAQLHDRVKAQIDVEGVKVADVDNRLVLFDGPPRIGVVIGERLTVHALTADTSVTVEQAGSITAVRGRNLASKAVAGAFTGGLGLFVVGNAKTETIDNRELYVIIESSEFAHVQTLDPVWAAVARHFAAQASMLVKRLNRE